MKAIVRNISAGTTKSTATFYDQFTESMACLVGKEINVAPIENHQNWFYGAGWQWHRDWLIFSPSLNELKSKAIELCVHLYETMDAVTAYLYGADVQKLRAIGGKAKKIKDWC